MTGFDTSLVTATILLTQFNCPETRNTIRRIAEESNGYASLHSVLTPVANRIPNSENEERDQAFDEVVLELLRRISPNLFFICRDFVDIHRVIVNEDGTPSNKDYSLVISKNNGKILFYGKGSKYVHATLDVETSLNRVELHGFLVHWI
jgi:hypothetical protein